MGRGGAFHRKKNKAAVAAAAAVSAPAAPEATILEHKSWYQSGPLSPFYLLWSALWLRALWLVRLISGQKDEAIITTETQAVTVPTIPESPRSSRTVSESAESVHSDDPTPSASAPAVDEPVEIVEDGQEAGPSTTASVHDEEEEDDEDETEEYEDRQSTSSEEAPVVRKEARVEYVSQYPLPDRQSIDETDYPEETYEGCSVVVELHRTSIEEVDEEDVDDESEDLGRSSSLSCCGPDDEDEDYDWWAFLPSSLFFLISNPIRSVVSKVPLPLSCVYPIRSVLCFSLLAEPRARTVLDE